MKKIVALLAFLTLALVACSKNDMVDPTGKRLTYSVNLTGSTPSATPHAVVTYTNTESGQSDTVTITRYMIQVFNVSSGQTARLTVSPVEAGDSADASISVNNQPIAWSNPAVKVNLSAVVP